MHNFAKSLEAVQIIKQAKDGLPPEDNVEADVSPEVEWPANDAPGLAWHHLPYCAVDKKLNRPTESTQRT